MPISPRPPSGAKTSSFSSAIDRSLGFWPGAVDDEEVAGLYRLGAARGLENEAALGVESTEGAFAFALRAGDAQPDAGDKADLRRDVGQRRVEQQSADVEIAGRRGPAAAAPPPARNLRARGDPQPARIAVERAPARLVIGRPDRVQAFDAPTRR